MRVAFFPDSFLEINGVAMTSQRLVGYAKQNGYPFLCVHAASQTETTDDGSVRYVKLKRSPLAFALDESLKFDPLFNRHLSLVKKELEKFKPDVIHWTGLNDISIMAAILAFRLNVPTVGSWHTNLHEFAAHRLDRIFGSIKAGGLTKLIEKQIFFGAKLYYRMPKLILAPNEELLEELTKSSKRAGRLMKRGVDTKIFAPEKRSVKDDKIRFGFVGRLRPEKNVRLLAELEKRLLAAGKTNFEFLIVGEGSEREWLEKNLKYARFTGFLDGEKLAEAFADMDVFAFPSETETFGNVVQEANAAGVPAIVTNQGGPKFIVRHDETGFIAENFEKFVEYAILLLDRPEKLNEMKRNARNFALSRSWDAVFEEVYAAYPEAVKIWEREENNGEKRENPV